MALTELEKEHRSLVKERRAGCGEDTGMMSPCGWHSVEYKTFQFEASLVCYYEIPFVRE